MSIDTRFLQTAKDKAQAARRAGLQFVHENPRLSVGAGAAMLLAPAVFSNDNRGYFQTSAVTTPLITAATYAAPSVVGAFRSTFSPHAKPTASRVADAWKSAQARKGVSYEDVRHATHDPSVPLNVRQDVERRFYSGRTKVSENVDAEVNALLGKMESFWGRGPATAGELQYLSNALHAEQLRTLSATQLYKTRLGGHAPTMLDREGINSVIAANLSNPKFVRGMNSRVARMRHMSFMVAPDPEIGAGVIPASYSPIAWNASETRSWVAEKDVAGHWEVNGRVIKPRGRFSYGDLPGAKWVPPHTEGHWVEGASSARLAQERPDLYAAIEDAIKAGAINPNNLELLALEKEGHPAVALRLAGMHDDPLVIPIVGKNGEVYLGDRLNRIGISRKVYTTDALFASDVYAIEALKRKQSWANIKHELARANIHGAIDATENFSTLVPPKYGEYVNADSSIALRSRQAVPSELFGFVNVDKDGKSEVVGFSKLNAETKEDVVSNVVSKFGFTKVGSEAGVAQGVFELEETNLLAAFGLANREKQNPAWRSYTKPIRLTKPRYNPGTGKVRDSLSPFFETDYMKKIAPHAERREVGIRVAGISGGEKTLFGDLPQTVDGLPAYRNQAVNVIRRDRNVSQQAAEQAWTVMEEWLKQGDNLSAMRRLGTLGEGDFLMREGLYGMNVERKVTYQVNKLNIRDWQSMLGTSLEDAMGVRPGQDVVIGYNYEGNPVIGGGSRNYIENVHDLGEGMMGVDVREVVPFGTGSKVDAGIKGLVSGVDTSTMKSIKSGLNQYYTATGAGGFIADEVEAIQTLHYAQNKEDPLEAVLSATGDTFRRLEESGELESVRSYLGLLEDQGLVYDQGTLTFETAALKSAKAEELRDRSLAIIEDMFADVSTRLERGRLKGDSFMQAFALSQEDSYLQWVHRYADPRTMRVWNTTQWNVPEEAKVTYDMMQQLSLKGYHGALADILDRVRYDGDPRMTAQLEKYFQGKGGIDAKVSFEEALEGLQGRELGSMGRVAQRHGTIFDPGHEKAAENFLLTLPDGTEVPVLGHNAYGGKVNRYGPGEFSSTEQEKSLMELMRAYQGETPVSMREEARKAYLDSLKKLVYGKESFYRADAVDAHYGLGQFIQTRASSLRYGDGTVNPFEIGIGRDMVEKIMDEDIRQALYRGEDVFAAVGRHPVSDLPFYKVTIDDELTGKNLIGIDEAARGLHMADDDQDMAYAFFMRRNREGHAEARAAVYGDDPTQRAAAAFQKQIESIADDPRSYFTTSEAEMSKAGAAMGDLKLKDVMKEARKARPSLDAALRARSTSGSIGAFSNTLTQMLIGLENNREITSAGQKREFARLFFTSVRQGPISASKLKNAAKAEDAMDLSQALGINAKLQRSLKAGGDFDEFYSALGELADAADAGKRSTFRDYIATNREVLRAYHRGFDRDAVEQAMRVLATPADKAAKARRFGMDPDIMSYVRAASTDEQAAASSGAQMSAETLGAWNRAKTAAREAGSSMKNRKVAMVVAGGLAVALAAGVATSSLAPRAQAVFGRDSGGGYRPEEGAGVSNQAPGAAQRGTRAARPQRTLIPSQAQTRTAVVAPIQETADLDVRYRPSDRGRAHETAKILRRMATDGDSNVTINYHDSKRTSLRSRERMRATLTED